MRLEPLPGDVKEIVTRMFVEYGAELSAVSDLQVAIRVDRGRCIARTYRVDGLMAMWLVEHGILQFYDAGGNMLRTVNLLEDIRPQRAAA